MATVAVEHDTARLSRVVHHYLSRLDPDGPEPDPTDERSLSIATLSDGTVVIRGQLDAVGGEKFKAAIESVVQADRPKGDLRTRSQQQADALVQVADNQLASGGLPFLRTVKPNVVVTTRDADLFARANGAATASTGFGSLISASKARMVACDGSVTPVLIDAHGMPLDMGRTKRVVPPHLRKAVELRDEACVFAGCGAPKYWCDVHHLVHWIFGGETSLENSALLCERHHTRVHHGFRVEREPGGRWRTFRPDDTEIVIGAPLLL